MKNSASLARRTVPDAESFVAAIFYLRFGLVLHVISLKDFEGQDYLQVAILNIYVMTSAVDKHLSAIRIYHQEIDVSRNRKDILKVYKSSINAAHT